MSIGDRLWHENRSRLFWLILALLGSISPDRGRAESCFVASEQSGIAFPAEKIAGDWSCRLQFVIDHHISASTVGPLKTAMAESLYLYLLDRPPVAAALINRLDLADYKSEERGPGRWWAAMVRERRASCSWYTRIARRGYITLKAGIIAVCFPM
jgi:hypothetical protein